MSKKKKKKTKFRSIYSHRKVNYRWIISITIATFIMAIVFGYSSLVLEEVDIMSASIILLLIVLMGVFFDGLGIAVTAAEETPFHSMAASKVKGAKESIKLIRNAGIVANFFNDVIGDISGIISGAVATAIIIRINTQYEWKNNVVNLLMTGLIAAITVGGKAAGKEIALRKANAIVYRLGLILYYSNVKRILIGKTIKNKK